MKFPHLIFMRCKAWRKWPSWTTISSPLMNLDSSGEFQFHFQISTYDQGEESGDNGQRLSLPAVFYNDENPHLLSSNVIVWDPNVVNTTSLDVVNPKVGEIDLQIHLFASEVLDIEFVQECCIDLLSMLLTYFNYVYRDALIPVAPLQFARPDSGTTMRIPLPRLIVTRNREMYDESFVQKELAALMVSCAKLSADRQRVLFVASRRLDSALREHDRVDKYSDLWEVCELLTKGVKTKGDKVSRIAHALSSHIGIKKSTIENKLHLREIYKTRGNLIHDGIESEEELGKHLNVLEEIATQLFCWRLDLKYSGSGIIDELLQTE